MHRLLQKYTSARICKLSTVHWQCAVHYKKNYKENMKATKKTPLPGLVAKLATICLCNMISWIGPLTGHNEDRVGVPDNEAVSPSVCCCCQVAAPRKCFLPRPLPATWPAAKKRNLQSSSAETRGLLGQCLAPPRPDHSQLAEAATVRGQGTLPAEWWLKRMSLSAWSLLLRWDEVIWIMIWIVLYLSVARVLGVEAPVAGRRRAPPPPLTSPRHQAASPQSGGTGHQDHCPY